MHSLFKLLTVITALVGTYLFTYNGLVANAETVNKDHSDGLLSQQLQNAKIAVIGSGIGGASAAHFLRKLVGTSAQIDVFEKSDRVGGRLHVITMDGQTMESGGTIIHSSNKYMTDFVKELGLETNEPSDDSSSRLGIYNGKQFVFTESSSEWFNNIKLIWRYGLFSLMHMNNSLKKMLEDFHKIYSLQDGGNAYSTVQDMLKAMGGQYFIDYTQKSCKQIMKGEGVNDRLIDELVTAVSRCNYGQSADEVNGFTGYVSLAGAQGGKLWNVKGGNYQVPQLLLQQAKVNLQKNAKVTSVHKETDKTTGKVTYFLDGVEQNSTPYDVVIVAAPLEVPSDFLECPNCKRWPQQKDLGVYQQTIANFVNAPVNYTHFGFQSKKNMPDAIFTTESKLLSFSSLGAQQDVNAKTTNPLIYKVFSRKPLTNEDLSELFIVDPKSLLEYSAITWLAYPHYTPPESFLPFELDSGVFYVNAIERAASAMEMSSIGGRNAALLAFNYLQGKEQSDSNH